MDSLSLDSAVTTIQKAWRAKCMKRAEHYINTPEILEKMKQATNGRTRVYFPGDFPRQELMEAGFALGIGDSWDTHDALVNEVFKELAQGGEIYYFDPCLISGGHRSTLLLS